MGITTKDIILFSILFVIFVLLFISMNKVVSNQEAKRKHWAKVLERWETLVYDANTLRQIIELRKLWEIEIVEKHDNYYKYRCDIRHVKYFRELNCIIIGKYSILKLKK